MVCLLHMRHTHKKKQRRKKAWAKRREVKENRETQRLAELLLAILDRSAVATATSSPRLVFGAASGITAEDLMFSTHLGSANMALHSSALTIPCLGHSGWHPSHWRWNLLPSARLTGGPRQHSKRFCCHTRCPINRCKQSMLPLLAPVPLPLSNLSGWIVFSLQSLFKFNIRPFLWNENRQQQ